MNISEKVIGFQLARPATWFCVTGSDALEFLQGQVTQDLRASERGAVSHGLWLTQKGRVVADSLFFKVSDTEIWLLNEETPAGIFRERLESYIISDDVVINDLGSGWVRLLAVGAGPVRWVEDCVGGPVPAGRFSRVGSGFVFKGRRGFAASVEWISDALPALPTWAGPALTHEDLERARLSAGIVNVPRDIGIGDLPNEGGLEESAISYVKGCYLGQETIARLKAMGQIRRKLLRVLGNGVAPAAGPHALFQGGKRVGELRTTANLREGGYLGFALVTLLGFDPVKGLSLDAEAIPTLRILPSS